MIIITNVKKQYLVNCKDQPEKSDARIYKELGGK